MVVKLTSGGQLLYPLTSPPAKPTPAPPPELIAKTVSYGDREIAVTIPFPDSIELVTEIVNDLQQVPDLSLKSAKEIYLQLDEDMQTSLMEVKLGLPTYISGSFNPAKTKATYFVAYDASEPLNKARLLLQRKAGTDYPSWSVRLEFSPSKAGPAGLVKLTAALEATLPVINVGRLLGAFRIARLDAAIDLIGAAPLDLIAHVPKPGKRMVYTGVHGRPESIYLYELKKPLTSPPKTLTTKTTGPHRLTLYERRDYHLQLLLQPPYGECPVTRVEVSRRWKKGRPSLIDIATVTNLFGGRRVAYAAGVPPKPSKEWKQFCLAAFGAGSDTAFWSWMPGPAPKFEKLYQDCAGDLVDQTSWERWEDGLAHTGLAGWIKMAVPAQ